MVIAIPSYKRPKFKTIQLLKDFDREDIFIFVNDDKEKADYEKENPGVNIIITGTKGITPARNAIINYFKDDERIMMLDDDIEDFRVMKIVDLKKVLFSIDNLKEFFLQGFALCDKLGYKLWGVQMCSVGTFMTRKLNNDKFIIGTAMGIINRHLTFDEGLKLKEDYDYTMQHIKEYGGALRFNFVTVKAGHYSNKGGCVDYRTEQLESDACEVLLNRYPGKIIRNKLRKNEIIIL